MLPIQPEVLKKLDLTAVVVEEGFAPEPFSIILEEMRGQACVHSWLNFASGAESVCSAVDALLEWEQRRRPTTFFIYYGLHARGRREPLGAGTVSDRVSFKFPYEGFPVIARCYIRAHYRGHGFYAALLQNRYEYCCTRWKRRLNAVHLGSAERKVVSVATNPSLISPPFRRVCTERLHIGDNDFMVHDFLSFQEDYARRLGAAVPTVENAGDGLPAAQDRLRRALDSLLHGDDMVSLLQIRRLWRRARDLGLQSNSDLDSLLALCEELSPPPLDE